MLSIFKNSGCGAQYPNPKAPMTATLAVMALAQAYLYGSTTSTTLAEPSFFFPYSNSEADATIGGGGYINFPPIATSDYRTTSSSKSTPLNPRLGSEMVEEM